MPEIKDKKLHFENKAWFRLIKVLYIVLSLMTSFFLVAITFDYMPRKQIDKDLTTIKCDNGKTYSLDKNNISVSGAALYGFEDAHAKILCKYDTIDFINLRYAGFIEKNYTLKPVYISPNYDNWFFISIIAFVIAWLVLKFIKIIGLYIIMGDRPDWGKEFKKII